MARKPTIAPRKPPRPDERDKFVAATQAPERPVTQAPKRPGARAPIVRADGRELRKLHVYVAAKTARELAVFCAETDRDQSNVVEEAVAKYLASAR